MNRLLFVTILWFSMVQIGYCQEHPLQGLSGWTNKAPHPYASENRVLIADSYKDNWAKSSAEEHPKAVQKAKKVLKEWGRNPDKYEYKGQQHDYEIYVSESPNFVSVIFNPIGLVGYEQHVEVRMRKKDLMVLSILPGA